MRYLLAALLAMAFAFPALATGDTDSSDMAEVVEPSAKAEAVESAADMLLEEKVPAAEPGKLAVGYTPKAARDANGNLLSEKKPATAPVSPERNLRRDQNLRSDRDILTR